MFQPESEAMPREQVEQLQVDRLNRLLARVYDRVPLYRSKFDEADVKPHVGSLADLAELPFTVKDDMRAHYPYGMFAAPRRDIVRVHASSGTTGQITVVGYTERDISNWADLMARTLACAGATPDDAVQVAYGYGLFTGGLGVHYGSERLGCLTIPISGGNTRRQVQVLSDFGVTVLACTPSYSLLVAETAEEMGIDLRSLPLRIGVFGAEPWSKNMRAQIEGHLGIRAIDIYGLSEILGPGVASECTEQHGLHVNEDYFLIEILDPQTLRRMERITGRTDDMLIIRGVNVFPSQIEQVLTGIPGGRAALPGRTGQAWFDGHCRGSRRSLARSCVRRSPRARGVAAHGAFGDRIRTGGLDRRQARRAEVDRAQ